MWRYGPGAVVQVDNDSVRVAAIAGRRLRPAYSRLVPSSRSMFSGLQLSELQLHEALPAHRCIYFHASTICTALAETGKKSQRSNTGFPEVI